MNAATKNLSETTTTGNFEVGTTVILHGERGEGYIEWTMTVTRNDEGEHGMTLSRNGTEYRVVPMFRSWDMRVMSPFRRTRRVARHITITVADGSSK